MYGIITQATGLTKIKKGNKQAKDRRAIGAITNRAVALLLIPTIFIEFFNNILIANKSQQCYQIKNSPVDSQGVLSLQSYKQL